MPQSLPLAGLCVVEIGHSLAAPYAGMVFASLGADVIKIESVEGGDYARDWGPPFINGASAFFHAINHSKSSVALSLSDPVSVSRLRRLIIERADVVLQNLKAGSIEKYGLGSAELRSEKPSLVYCNLGAFGTVGPLRDKPGYDPLAQALGGLMSFLGNEGDKLSRIPVSVNDMGTGLWATIGVLAALVRRAKTGTGDDISVSLYETAVTWSAVQVADYLASGVLPGRWGSGTAAIVPYQAFDCSDQPIIVAAGNDRLFRSLCSVLDAEELAGDPRFRTNGDRVKNREALIEKLSVLFRTRPSAEWLEALGKAGVPCGLVQTIGQVVAHEQTKALDLIKTTADGAARVVGLPISFGGKRPETIGHVPRLGENNDILDAYSEAAK